MFHRRKVKPYTSMFFLKKIITFFFEESEINYDKQKYRKVKSYTSRGVHGLDKNRSKPKNQTKPIK